MRIHFFTEKMSWQRFQEHIACAFINNNFLDINLQCALEAFFPYSGQFLNDPSFINSLGKFKMKSIIEEHSSNVYLLFLLTLVAPHE